jgi:hypothetical protein
MRCRYPQLLKVVRFVGISLLFNRLNVSLADISCVLGNGGVGGAAQLTQPVTLYITVNITPPNLHNSSPSIPTVGDASPAEEATIPGRIQFPTPEHLLPPSHHQPVKTGNAIPQSREVVSPTGTKDPHVALHRADESMKRIVPIDGSNTWQSAVGKVKWVMDTLGPIAEVRPIPFSYISLAEPTSSLSFPHSQRWRTDYFLQSPRHVHL